VILSVWGSAMASEKNSSQQPAVSAASDRPVNLVRRAHPTP
jgi:hypothetical protein